MKKLLIIALCQILSVMSSGQSEPNLGKWEGITYTTYDKSNLFADLLLEIGLLSDFPFLEGIAQSLTSIDTVKLDVYTDLNRHPYKRPCIIFLHGGGFVKGSKEDPSIVYLCKYFARKGYVTVSIDYRMIAISRHSVNRAGYAAAQDAKAAIKFLKYNSDLYGIDKKNMFIGGISAGAITSINAGFMSDSDMEGYGAITDYHGCLECVGDYAYLSSSVNGIINIAGGVADINILKNIKIPLLQFHGLQDNIVQADVGLPFASLSSEYNSALQLGMNSIHMADGIVHNYITSILDDHKVPSINGSRAIHKFMKSKSRDVKTYIFEKSGHSLIMSDSGAPRRESTIILNAIHSFVYENTK